jgi:glycosyltransferase involved in cell wall biosynthesis
MIGIVIPTYKRKDGSTKINLTHALTSIKNQTYQNYKVFLIGDDYEDNDEFIELATSIIDKDKIYYENLPHAVERSKYIQGKILWTTGGVNANNYGIEKCLSEGINHICHLDHDDFWETNHLEEISQKLNDNFIIIVTKSLNFDGQIFPPQITNPYYPENSFLIHSSVCIDFSKCHLRYRDTYAEEGRIYPSDADLWNRLKKFMLESGEIGVMIDKVTCYHTKENY